MTGVSGTGKSRQVALAGVQVNESFIVISSIHSVLKTIITFCCISLCDLFLFMG